MSKRDLIKKGIDYLKYYGVKELARKTEERLVPEPFPYSRWYPKHLMSQGEMKESKEYEFNLSPVISVIVPAFETDPGYLIQLIRSMQDQLYGKFQLCIADGSESSRVSDTVSPYLSDSRIFYKKLENNAEIKNNIKGMYIVSFPDASICADFQEYYDNYLRIDEENKVPSTKYKTATSEENRLVLPKINNNYCYNNKNINKGDEKSKSISSYKYNPYDDRRKAINNVILNNSKTDLISEKCIRNGKYRMHNYGKNYNQKSFEAKNRNNYKGMYKSPYMNDEEKYYREKFLDKKKWLNKNGFLPSVNRKNINNFIPNYVTATPSESPLLFMFRDVSKDKWINPKGFH